MMMMMMSEGGGGLDHSKNPQKHTHLKNKKKVLHTLLAIVLRL